MKPCAVFELISYGFTDRNISCDTLFEDLKLFPRSKVSLASIFSLKLNFEKCFSFQRTLQR